MLIVSDIKYNNHLVMFGKSETQSFDGWLTSSLRIQCNFPLAHQYLN